MAIALVYSGPNQTGKVFTASTFEPQRYAHVGLSGMQSAGVGNAVSSVNLFPGPGFPALILFAMDLGDVAWNPYLQNFSGEFMQFTNGADVQFKQNLDGQLAGFDNRATSLMVVRTRLAAEQRLSFANLFVAHWTEFINSTLGDQVLMIGPPEIRLVAFSAHANLNPNRVYIRVRQKIFAVLPSWSDYEASITYFLRFWPEAGRVAAGVQRWEYWIESGAFTDVVKAILEPNVELGAIKLAQRLNTAFGMLAPGVTDVYLLPGTQTGTVGEGEFNVLWADANEDVTLVIERK